MKLRAHDKCILNLIATTKSEGGRYYDFEALLEWYGKWSRSGILVQSWATNKHGMDIEAYSFLDSEDVLLFLDYIVAKFKHMDEHKTNFLAFELYFLIPETEIEERRKKEKLFFILRKADKANRSRKVSMYVKSREVLQELIRKDVIKLIKEQF